MAMTIKLPNFICVKSKMLDWYLRFIPQVHGEEPLNECLKFYGDEVVSPYIKFEVEMAKNAEELVHIRSCYNNKYLVRVASDSYIIAAQANEPEEDQCKWSCTMFRPDRVGAWGDAQPQSQIVQFFHVQLGSYAYVHKSFSGHEFYFYVADSNIKLGDESDVFTILDWGSLCILPRHVTFKGSNGKYLRDMLDKDQLQYLQFEFDDPAYPAAWYEVFPARDGNIRIKSNHFGAFWRRTNKWIMPDMDENTSLKSVDALFWPIKVDENVIALRNIVNNSFCNLMPDYTGDLFLGAIAPTICKEALLHVHELIISRKVYNVDFHLLNARIYNKRVLTIATGAATNMTGEPSTTDIKMKYIETRYSRWFSNVSLKLGIKSSLEASIPIITATNVDTLDEFSGQYEWGRTIESSTTKEIVHRFFVPPMTTVKVRLIATKGTCDVPFSYTQNDTLMNGNQVTYTMDDGLYTGANIFNFDYLTEEKKLC